MEFERPNDSCTSNKLKSRRLDPQGSTASGKVTPHLRQSRDIPPAKS
jgi:hypothetical protein